MRGQFGIRSLTKHNAAVAAGLAAGSYNLAPTSNCGWTLGFVIAGGSTLANAYGGARTAATFGDAIGDKDAGVSTTSCNVGQSAATNSVDGGFDAFIWQTLLEFDTLLQAGRSISAATFSIYLSTKSATQAFNIDLAVKDFGSGVDINDYVVGGSLSASPIATRSTSVISAATLTQFSADFSGSIVTSGAGKTRLILYSRRNQNNSAPANGVNEFVTVNPSSCRLNLTVA